MLWSGHNRKKSENPTYILKIFATCSFEEMFCWAIRLKSLSDEIHSF